MYINGRPSKKVPRRCFPFLLEEVEWESLLQEFTIILPEGKANQRVGEETNIGKYERTFPQEVVKRRCIFSPHKDFQNPQGIKWKPTGKKAHHDCQQHLHDRGVFFASPVFKGR